MILSSKQLEELETLSSSSMEFEESGEEGELVDEGVESVLAWRRGMIERALNNVKKVQRNTEKSLKEGSLVYLEESKRFARVSETGGSTIRLAFISGGEVVLGPKEKTSSSKTATASKSEPKAQVSIKKPAAKAKTPAIKTGARVQKPVIKPVTKKVKHSAKSASTSSKAITSKTKISPKSDPNAYIKQNFQRLNNKDLAKLTGLSEHTIRRKLGEWGMRRAERIPTKK